MRALFALVLIFGVGLAGFAVYMANDFLSGMRSEVQRLQAEKARMPAMVEVIVADTRKDYGERLQKDDVTTVMWQEDSLPEGIFRTMDELFPASGEERAVLRTIGKFEPVVASKVTDPGEAAGLAWLLEEGMRAFTIRVDEISGVSGFVNPGNHVDVYWTGRGGEALVVGSEITRLIEPMMRVIAVDQTSDVELSSPTVVGTITVESTPQQVARLQQAQSSGRISLSLVPADEVARASGKTTVADVNQGEITNFKPEQEQEISEVQRCFAKVRRGAETIQTDTEIPCIETN